MLLRVTGASNIFTRTTQIQVLSRFQKAFYRIFHFSNACHNTHVAEKLVLFIWWIFKVHLKSQKTTPAALPRCLGKKNERPSADLPFVSYPRSCRSADEIVLFWLSFYSISRRRRYISSTGTVYRGRSEFDVETPWRIQNANFVRPVSRKRRQKGVSCGAYGTRPENVFCRAKAVLQAKAFGSFAMAMQDERSDPSRNSQTVRVEIVPTKTKPTRIRTA